MGFLHLLNKFELLNFLVVEAEEEEESEKEEEQEEEKEEEEKEEEKEEKEEKEESVSVGGILKDPPPLPPLEYLLKRYCNSIQ